MKDFDYSKFIDDDIVIKLGTVISAKYEKVVLRRENDGSGNIWSSNKLWIIIDVSKTYTGYQYVTVVACDNSVRGDIRASAIKTKFDIVTA